MAGRDKKGSICSRAESHPRAPDYSGLDLQADCSGSKDAEETIQMLPEKPGPLLLAKILHQVSGLGRMHAAASSISFL